MASAWELVHVNWLAAAGLVWLLRPYGMNWMAMNTTAAMPITQSSVVFRGARATGSGLGHTCSSMVRTEWRILLAPE